MWSSHRGATRKVFGQDTLVLRPRNSIAFAVSQLAVFKARVTAYERSYVRSEQRGKTFDPAAARNWAPMKIGRRLLGFFFPTQRPIWRVTGRE
jgi:hypothetical protein